MTSIHEDTLQKGCFDISKEQIENYNKTFPDIYLLFKDDVLDKCIARLRSLVTAPKMEFLNTLPNKGITFE